MIFPTPLALDLAVAFRRPVVSAEREAGSALLTGSMPILVPFFCRLPLPGATNQVGAGTLHHAVPSLALCNRYSRQRPHRISVTNVSSPGGSRCLFSHRLDATGRGC
jgi:hypothetical protein